MSPGKVMKAPTIGFLADIYYFSLVVLGQLALWGGSIWCVLTCFLVDIKSGRIRLQDAIGVAIILGIPCVILTVLFFFSRPQWATIVTMSPDGIRYGPFFKKQKFYTYDDFPLVYRASYIHGLVGAPNFGPEIVYIILSKRRLTEIEKNNINEVATSEELIKIKYSKKRYAQLMEILPPNLSSQLNAVFLAYRKPDDLALRRSAITAKARRRKKQKRK